MNKKNIKKRNLLAATNKMVPKIIVIGSKLIYIYDLFSPPWFGDFKYNIIEYIIVIFIQVCRMNVYWRPGSKAAKPVRCGMDTIVKINLQHKFLIFVISFFPVVSISSQWIRTRKPMIRSDIRGRVHLDDNNTCTGISTEKND